MVGDAVGDRGLDRHLGEVAQHPLGRVEGVARSPCVPCPTQPAMTWASWNVRRTVSIIRPIPCESELTIAIAPSSWSGPSAAIVGRMDPLRDECDVLGDRRTTRRG